MWFVIRNVKRIGIVKCECKFIFIILVIIHCFNDLSYENWLEYKKEQEFWEKEKAKKEKK